VQQVGNPKRAILFFGDGAMCGICGEILKDWRGMQFPRILQNMMVTLRHRGPDDEGFVTGPGFGLAATRLAVIDTSTHAQQPFSNEDETIHLVFNGEIYNHVDLRRDLEARGHRFRSRCDAEVVLHLYEEEGEACLRKLRGMFAFAIFNVRNRTLFAARDRMGQKPLYYYDGGDFLAFASEIKALLSHPGVEADADLPMVRAGLSLGYTPGEATAFRGIRRLPHAHYLRWRDGRYSVRRYWRLGRQSLIEAGHDNGQENLARELLERVREAVRMRLRSDVPVGVLLSGGLDSSCVAALAAAASGARIRTFSIGFAEKEYDERPHARKVAAQIGANHTERIVRSSEAAALIPRLIWHMEEPFADSSALATYCAADLARGRVKVVLNGDGGDENFAGYLRYGAHNLASRAAALPQRLRRAAGWFAYRLVRGESVANGTKERVRRFLRHITRPPVERYLEWCSCFEDEDLDVLLSDEFTGPRDADFAMAAFRSAWAGSTATESDSLGRLLDVDLFNYLPGDLLVKMDRMTMASSLEARSPFLDHELVEFAAKIPPELKIRGLFGTKRILKKAVREILPPAVVHRPKAGFAVPIDSWFRGELRDFTHDILLGRKARQRGLIRPEGVSALIKEHDSGRINRHHQLWTLLTLELWFRTFLDGVKPVREKGFGVY